MATALFNLLVFPGLLFVIIGGLAFEYIDRKVHARMQNRIGPPWFQPFADLVKLLAKESIVPENADRRLFQLIPVVALAAVVTSFLYIPLWKSAALYSFSGDLIVVFYLLTIPSMALFLAGWGAVSLYSLIGAVRCLTQLFAYEVPFFMGILAPCILADTWSLSGVADYYQKAPALALVNVIGFGVALVALLGKLEKVPFDIPEAETEIVAGPLTEYSGWMLALFRLTLDIELFVGASLLAAVFLPFGFNLPGWGGFIVYVLKLLAVVGLLTLLRTLFARLRLEQMVDFCWKYLAPAALLQLVISLSCKAVLNAG
ncbi:MAG: NADH-quinone oxidoreductase subunit H [Kiritimatiellae bacterium]|nr:NADH-quinone oxidoreductase subunit H [Kiritimatiellia bacterium]